MVDKPNTASSLMYMQSASQSVTRLQGCVVGEGCRRWGCYCCSCGMGIVVMLVGNCVLRSDVQGSGDPSGAIHP